MHLIKKLYRAILKRHELGLLKKLIHLSSNSIKLYIYLKEGTNIWNDILSNRVVTYDPLKSYSTFYFKKPFNYRRIIRNQDIVDGIPRYNYLQGYSYNPVKIVQYGLAEYGYFISSKKSVHLRHFINVLDFLRNVVDKGDGKLYYDFDYKMDGTDFILKRPWISSMAQGEAISLFCRAFELTGDEKYINCMQKVVAPLTRSYEEGGTLYDTMYGIFLEEYPCSIPFFTLNGFMFTVIGLYDYLNVIRDNKLITDIYHGAICTLKNILPLYESDSLTYYDLSHLMVPSKRPQISYKYHYIHVKQLRNIADITCDNYFYHYYCRWKYFSYIGSRRN